MIEDLVIIDKAGVVHLARRYIDANTNVALDGRSYSQMMSSIGLLSGLALADMDPDSEATLDLDVYSNQPAKLLHSETIARNLPIIAITMANSVYGGLAIGPLTYIVRGPTALCSTTLVEAFLSALRDMLLVLHGPALLTASHKQAVSLIAVVQPLVAALVADNIQAAFVPTLFSATQAAPVDAMTRAQLDRVLAAASLSSVVAQAVFSGARPLLSRLPPRVTRAAHLLLLARPLEPGCMVATYPLYPFADDLAADEPSLATAPAAAAAPAHSLVVLRLQHDAALVLLVDGPAAAPELAALGRDLAAVAAETGLVFPRALAAPPLPAHAKPHVIAAAAVSGDTCLVYTAAHTPALPAMLAAAAAALPALEGSASVRQQGMLLQLHRAATETVLLLSPDTAAASEAEEALAAVRHCLLAHLLP